MYKFIFNLLCHRYFSDFTIFNNYSGRELFLKKGFMPSKSIVIHNCINNIKDEIIRPERGTVKILSVGRFTFQKDYLTALKTIASLQKICLDKKIEYTIIGDGELEDQIITWIKDLEVSNVRILKLPEIIEDFYQDADIYFLSSLYEGLPNTIMEAMNYSLPVVSTNVSDVKYLVKEEFNGYLAPAKNHNLLCEKLYDLVLHPEMRIAFGLNGHRLIMEEFSELKFQKTYLQFTEQLLST